MISIMGTFFYITRLKYALLILNSFLISNQLIETMELCDYINQAKELHSILLNYIDDDCDFSTIEKTFLLQKYHENIDELREFIYMILIICNNRNRKNNFFQKIEKIILYLKDDIKRFFSDDEIFQLFESNKRILLFLFQNNFITIDNSIVEMITQKNKEFINFFYLEIKGKIDKETESSISNELLKYDQNIFNTFEENRQNGENDSYICKLIRQDLIIEFIQYVNQTNYQISAVINSSLFETNSFLLEQQPTLIEYAAFYGSIQIFQYLLMNNVELSPSLWLFAIHGRNAELIHLLEQIRLIPSDKSYYKCFEESIKCHHNEIAHYIQENLINKNVFLTDSKFDPFFKDNEFSYGFHYFNYEFFPKKANYRFMIHYACKYGYLTIVKLFSKKNDLKTKEEIIISKKKH